MGKEKIIIELLKIKVENQTNSLCVLMITPLINIEIMTKRLKMNIDKEPKILNKS